MLNSLTRIERDIRKMERLFPESSDSSRTASNEWRKYRDKPAQFVADLFEFPEGESPAPYQADALENLMEHRRVALRGPHSLGKSALMAWTVLWFACTRPRDTKVLTTATAWRQLEKFLWPEIHKWFNRADWDKWQQMGGYPPQMFKLKFEVGDSCEAFALASDTPENLEGAHGANLLYIFDEAKAIPNETWDAVEGAFASGDAYWLAASTPGERAGRFYEIHRRAAGFEDWYVRHITLEEAVEAGRIDPAWVDRRRRQWGENSPVYQARVLGKFPEMSEDALVSLAWVEEARERGLEPEGEPTGGLDVASTGADDSAIVVRQGDVVLSAEWWHGHDLMQTTGKAKSYEVPLAVDNIGEGKGVEHRLREQRVKVTGVNVGSSARDKEHFKNLRAELFWNLRERFRDGEIDLSRLPRRVYDRLSGELTAIKFEYTSRGKIKIEPKDRMKSRLGRSPDLADALALAFAPTTAPLPDKQPERDSRWSEGDRTGWAKRY